MKDLSLVFTERRYVAEFAQISKVPSNVAKMRTFLHSSTFKFQHTL